MTTLYLDRPSIPPCPPISDAFVSKEYFFCVIQMIQLWHLQTNGHFHIDKQNIFCNCNEMCLNWVGGGVWGDEMSFSKHTLALCFHPPFLTKQGPYPYLFGPASFEEGWDWKAINHRVFQSLASVAIQLKASKSSSDSHFKLLHFERQWTIL